MSKNSTKNAARQRRRARQKQLIEAGRQAEDIASQGRQQAVEAAGRAEQLEAEVVKLRHDLGESTALLAETNKALVSNTTILEGLRTELDMAAQQIKMVEAERNAIASDLSSVRRELEAAKAADSDARSLRARLQRKTEEIDDLKAKLRSSEERNRATTSLVLDSDKRRLVRAG